MTPRKFIHRIFSIKNRVSKWTNIGWMGLIIAYVLYAEYPYDIEEHWGRYLFILAAILITHIFWLLIQLEVDSKLKDETNKRIKEESDQLVDLLIRNKVHVPCKIRSVLESIDRIEIKDHDRDEKDRIHGVFDVKD
jgi:hypothetical protein